MQNLNERIRKVLEITDLKQEVFALATGISIDRLKNIIAGKIKNLRPDEARNIRTAYNVHELWLLTGRGPMMLSESDLRIQPSLDDVKALTMESIEFGLSAENTQIFQDFLFYYKRKDREGMAEFLNRFKSGIIDFVLVPKHEVAASAGNGSTVNNEAIVDYLAFKNQFINTLGVDPNHLALIDVRGDSMSPTINDGDLVLLDTRAHNIKSEGVYVINFNGVLLLKRIRIRVSGGIDIISDNELYGVETISGEQLGELLFIGRVVWHGCKF